ncbi:MAG: hypothetical protein P4L22_04160 [Candidatus Babeliales bacterium]|nr:hypothetical protein [Candidatus Babeliales bacterium]
MKKLLMTLLIVCSINGIAKVEYKQFVKQPTAKQLLATKDIDSFVKVIVDKTVATNLQNPSMKTSATDIFKVYERDPNFKKLMQDKDITVQEVAKLLPAQDKMIPSLVANAKNAQRAKAVASQSAQERTGKTSVSDDRLASAKEFVTLENLVTEASKATSPTIKKSLLDSVNKQLKSNKLSKVSDALKNELKQKIETLQKAEPAPKVETTSKAKSTAQQEYEAYSKANKGYAQELEARMKAEAQAKAANAKTLLDAKAELAQVQAQEKLTNLENKAKSAGSSAPAAGSQADQAMQDNVTIEDDVNYEPVEMSESIAGL